MDLSFWNDLDQPIKAGIVTAFIAAGTAIIKWIITPRSKIGWGISHQHVFRIQENDREVAVYTREIWIQNVGRATAKDIIVALNYPTKHIEFWPPQNSKIINLGDGRPAIKIDRIVKRDFLTIHLFNIDYDLPVVLYVRWDDGVATQFPMGPQQIITRPKVEFYRISLVLGWITMIYLCIRLIQFIAS
ncbi:hypothetical protein EJV44_08945 [Ancylobacter aquaticus]|nr:hypothetical protein EJV44_08945 [Ancylobacter aquaticus]